MSVEQTNAAWRQVGDSGESGGDAAHRAQSFDRVFDNLHAGGQLG